MQAHVRRGTSAPSQTRETGSFKYPDSLCLFLANTPAEQLACLTTIRISTSRVAGLRHFRDIDIKLWRKLAALQCLKLTP
jgi:hypothetical protein